MAGGFFDTSGMDAQNVYGGTTNNAAADFDRLSSQNQGWFGGKDKKEAQHAALQKSVDSPATPTPANPTASPNPTAKPQLSSATGLVKSVLQQIANPPQYNASGASLVPGTPFTPQEFAQQLVQNTVQHMNALAPPPEALQASPGDVRSPAVAPYQGIPQFGPTAEGPPQREQQSLYGNNQFGGNQFGGNRFGGNQFGGGQFQGMQRLPMQPGEQPQPQQMPLPAGPQSPMDPRERILALARAGRQVPQHTQMPVGHFRGGSIHMMRGGYPDLMGGMPVREHATGGVPSDGEGDGRSDHVDAKLSPGEFVQDAETVALLGNGDSDAGARGMEAIRQIIRKEKGKALAKGKFSPNSKKPGYYAQVGMRAAAKGVS